MGRSRCQRSRTSAFTGLVIACFLIGGCNENQPSTPRKHSTARPWFEERGEASGLTFRHVSGHRELHRLREILGAGVCLADFDGDGYLDIYFVQGGNSDAASEADDGNVLFRNRGDGTFEDVTEASSAADGRYAIGCSCGDYDGDGDIDLYVTNAGPNTLLRNDGRGVFTDVTSIAGVGDDSIGTGSAFVDYDADGHLDLFVVNYVGASYDENNECIKGGRRDYCTGNDLDSGATNVLYRNKGDGTFTDVTAVAGLDGEAPGLGLAYGDFDRDGRLDLFVANDGAPNQLWFGRTSGTFTDHALLAGCAVDELGIIEADSSAVPLDVENDGDLDLLVLHAAHGTNSFYRNDDGLFTGDTARTGLAVPSIGHHAFTAAAADFDHDGLLDLYVVNGRRARIGAEYDRDDRYAEPDQLFRGLPGGRFEKVLPDDGTEDRLIHAGRGAALGDLDNDGDVDLVVTNKDARPYLLLNTNSKKGDWVMFRVRDRQGRDAVGSWVGIDCNGRRQWRPVQTAYGFGSSHDPRVHFGLADAARVDAVTVRWPDGREESFGLREANKLHELIAGNGRMTEPVASARCPHATDREQDD